MGRVSAIEIMYIKTRKTTVHDQFRNRVSVLIRMHPSSKASSQRKQADSLQVSAFATISELATN